MAKARHLYELWGAVAKVRDLDRRYPTLLAGGVGRGAPQSESNTSRLLRRP